MNLKDHQQSVAFYESRYNIGYMENWPQLVKRRILKLIKELTLPLTGEVLDFGCGNGILTDLIHQALPSWKVYGADISRTAVKNARSNYPECIFFTPGAPEFYGKKFDFIFSHHVLEHLFDIDAVFEEMDTFLKPESYMLHILPSGNEGSYEHKFCLLRKDGIESNSGRFFYEEEAHLRRLTTRELENICGARQFKLVKQFYSNHYFGSLNWITQKRPKFILNLTDRSKAVNDEARQILTRERTRLLMINIFRLPAVIFSMIRNTKKKHSGHYLLMLITLPFIVFSLPVNYYLNKKSWQEWNSNRTNPAGSEMFLFFSRTNS